MGQAAVAADFGNAPKLGPSSRLAFAVFLSFFPIAVSGVTGFRAADRTALRLCRSLIASTWQTFIKVRVPYAIPHIFAGLKVGVTVATIGVVIGEFVTAQEGLGYNIMFASSAAETALVFAAIILLCAIGMVLYGASRTGGMVRPAVVWCADQRRRV
jgi:NitT/TauT family transport system permease protein